MLGWVKNVVRDALSSALGAWIGGGGALTLISGGSAWLLWPHVSHVSAQAEQTTLSLPEPHRVPPDLTMPQPVQAVVQSQPPLMAPLPTAPRAILDISFNNLISMLDDKTDIQQDKIIALYNGKWLRANGEIANVFRNSGYNYERVGMALYIPRQGYRSPFTQVVSFDAEWIDRVEALPVGQKIAVLCRIEGASNHSPRLGHCERESVEATTAKKK